MLSQPLELNGHTATECINRGWGNLPAQGTGRPSRPCLAVRRAGRHGHPGHGANPDNPGMRLGSLTSAGHGEAEPPLPRRQASKAARTPRARSTHTHTRTQPPHARIYRQRSCREVRGSKVGVEWGMQVSRNSLKEGGSHSRVSGEWLHTDGRDSGQRRPRQRPIPAASAANDGRVSGQCHTSHATAGSDGIFKGGGVSRPQSGSHRCDLDGRICGGVPSPSSFLGNRQK